VLLSEALVCELQKQAGLADTYLKRRSRVSKVV
jgi:hypothetical protein